MQVESVEADGSLVAAEAVPSCSYIISSGSSVMAVNQLPEAVLLSQSAGGEDCNVPWDGGTQVRGPVDCHQLSS